MNEKNFAYSAGGKRYAGAVIPPRDGSVKAAVALLPDWRGAGPLARAAARVRTQIEQFIADAMGAG